MMGLRLILLIFGLAGYIGAGAALAAARFRGHTDGERDFGLVGVGVMLFLFGALCTIVSVGMVGVLAVGSVTVWASYVFTSQRMGVFRIQANAPPDSMEEERAEESRRVD